MNSLYRFLSKGWHIQGGLQKTGTLFYVLTSYVLNSSNINRFLNLFHCLDQENNLDPTTPQVCLYTTF